MNQGSSTWLQWRTKGIGSSDAPIIMGVSPWKTPHELFLEKTGMKLPGERSWAMQKGVDQEPAARAHYELMTGREMPAVTCEHEAFRFLRASLDGWNTTERKALEIKCPGKKDHQLALEGVVPEKYFPQLQHLILVSGARSLDYFSYRDRSGVIIEVMPDLEYIQRLLVQEFAFWGMVQSGLWIENLSFSSQVDKPRSILS